MTKRSRSIEKLIETFWSRVKIIDDEHSCWEWQRGKAGGYGVMMHQRKQIRVHRFIYELANGPVPPGHQVLHHCDNRACVRLLHLFAGTIADNMKDKTSKGRQARGDRNGGGGKLTEEDVREVRSLEGQMRTGILASTYGVSKVMIRRIQRRKAWTHL